MWPTINASLNALSAALLLTGFFFIRARRVKQHRAMMLAAFAVSTVFLFSYLAYHYQAGAIRFQKTGWIRPVYFSLLLSHTLLAAAVVPLALVALARALRANYERHKAVARWTLPVWLYVSLSGVAVYLMLYRL
jgi:uncharacterized membrane protein YozB (DUF420 family)